MLLPKTLGGRRKARHDQEDAMLTSRDRILTTHVGSLPRNDKLTELLIKREAGAGRSTAKAMSGPNSTARSPMS